MAPQVSRLLLVFAAFVALFLGFRSMAVPEGFGTRGFHRVEAPEELRKNPMLHAGRNACADCHADAVEFTPHFKAGLSCETCHGPSKAHVEDFEKFKPEKPDTRQACGRCHQKLVARPSSVVPQVDLKEHNPGQRCISCHTIHEEAGDE